MARLSVQTDEAPAAIGTYSQAVRAGDTVYMSGQIPLDPDTGEMIEGDIEAQIKRIFDSIVALTDAAGGTLADIVKINVYLTDLSNFPVVNRVMAVYFSEPYPARAAIGVAALPKDAEVEVDAVMVLSRP
ncbi:MAG: RidA family protein [Gammaproteobacteria bacterium]